jgi:hypothetical protein
MESKIMRRHFWWFFAVLMALSSAANAIDCSLLGLLAHSEGSSQFFRVNTNSDDVIYAANSHADVDLTSIAVHPDTGEWYAISGNNAQQPGKLYKISQETDDGPTALETIGNTNLSNIKSLAFDQSGQLWAWNIGTGLYKIDIATGESEGPIVEYDVAIGDMTFSPDGNSIYATQSTYLHQYHFGTETLSTVCDNLPGEAVGLMMSVDGTFYLGIPENQEVSVLTIPSCTHVKFKRWVDGDIDNMVGVTLSCQALTENPLSEILIEGCDVAYEYQVEDMEVTVGPGKTGLQKKISVTTKDEQWDMTMTITVKKWGFVGVVKMKRSKATYRTRLKFKHEEVLVPEPKTEFVFEIPLTSKSDKIQSENCSSYMMTVRFK